MAPSIPAVRTPSFFRWAMTIGGIGFAVGFFGPIALNPDANQGPLVGIFISGPGGAFLGLLLWIAVRQVGLSVARQWQLIWLSSALLACATLFYCLPEPVLRGYLVDAQIRGCKPPSEMTDDAIAYWQKRVAHVTWASSRPGWQGEARRTLHDDQAVVLDLKMIRSYAIYENRKPWNKGSISVKNLPASDDHKSYYARNPAGSCADYAEDSRTIGFIGSEIPKAGSAHDWPPRDSPGLLNLESLEPIPAEYKEFSPN